MGLLDHRLILYLFASKAGVIRFNAACNKLMVFFQSATREMLTGE